MVAVEDVASAGIDEVSVSGIHRRSWWVAPGEEERMLMGGRELGMKPAILVVGGEGARGDGGVVVGEGADFMDAG